MKKGSVTIYFSIILISVIALLGIMMEKARVLGMEADAYNSLYLAVDSAFAGYGKQLYEQYGLFGLWESEEAAAGEVAAALLHNINPGQGLSASIMNMHHMSMENIDMEVTTLMDEGGYYFAKQAAETMKINTEKSALDFLLDKSGMLEEAGMVSDFFRKVDNYQERFETVSNALANVEERLRQVAQDLQNPKEGISRLVENLREASGEKGTEQREDEKKREQEEFCNAVREALKEEENIWNEWSEIAADIDSYKQNAGEIREMLDEEKQNILREYDKDQSDMLEEEVDRFQSVFGIGADDKYGVGEAETITKQALTLLTDSKEALMELLNSDEFNQDSVMEQLQKNKEALELLQNLNIHYINRSGSNEEVSDGFLNQIKEMVNGEILSLVADDMKLPNSAITGENIPSQINDSEWEGAEASNAAEDKAWLIYYALHYFGSYENQNTDTVMVCELEYLAGGKQREKDNLEQVVEELWGVRESFNLLYLLGDSEKRNAAYEMAMMIPGVAAQPVLAVVIQGVILTAWAAGESLLDVRTLLQGNKVPLVKNDVSWQLSLQQLQDLTEAVKGNRGTEEGFTYRQYIAMILMMQSRENLCMRMLDLIQCNLQKNVNSSFLIKDCICKADVNVILRGQILFPEISDDLDSGYSIQASVHYQY